MLQISFGKTVCDVEVKALLNTVHHSLAKGKTENQATNRAMCKLRHPPTG